MHVQLPEPCLAGAPATRIAWGQRDTARSRVDRIVRLPGLPDRGSPWRQDPPMHARPAFTTFSPHRFALVARDRYLEQLCGARFARPIRTAARSIPRVMGPRAFTKEIFHETSVCCSVCRSRNDRHVLDCPEGPGGRADLSVECGDRSPRSALHGRRKGQVPHHVEKGWSARYGRRDFLHAGQGWHGAGDPGQAQGRFRPPGRGRHARGARFPALHGVVSGWVEEAALCDGRRGLRSAQDKGEPAGAR